MRFNMNSIVEIDRNRNVGITSAFKNYVCKMTYDKILIALNVGWNL